MTLRRVILILLVGAFVAGAVWAATSGHVSPEGIDRWLVSLGPIAPVMFVAGFVGGAMIGFPGMVFVVAGRLAFGPETGFALGYGGGVLACVVPFATSRLLRRGEERVWRPRRRFVRRLFDMVESRPLRAVVLIRLIFWFNPPLSYALAMTRVPAGAYVAGCAIALAPVVAVAMFATGWFV